MKVTDADLAIVVNFGETSLTSERLPNFIRILVQEKILLATIAVTVIDEAMKRRMKAFMQMLQVKMGIIADFHQTQLEIVIVR